MEKIIKHSLGALIIAAGVVLGGVSVKADAVAAPTPDFQQLTTVTDISNPADISQQVPLYPGHTNGKMVTTSFPNSLGATVPKLNLDTKNFYANYTRSGSITPLTTTILVPFNGNGKVTLATRVNSSKLIPVTGSGPDIFWESSDFGDTILDLYAPSTNTGSLNYTRVGSNINPLNVSLALLPSRFNQNKQLTNINFRKPNYNATNYFVIYTHFKQGKSNGLDVFGRGNQIITAPNPDALRITNAIVNGYPSNLNVSQDSPFSLTLGANFLYETDKISADYILVGPQATIQINPLITKPTVNPGTWNSDGSYTITGSLGQMGDSITASMNDVNLTTPINPDTNGNWLLTIPNATAGNPVTFTESDNNLVAANSGATNDPVGEAIAEIGPKPLAFHPNDGTWQPIKFYQADGNNSNIPKDNQTFDLGKVQKNYVYGSTWNAFLDNYTAGKKFSITATSAGLTLAGHKTVPLYYTNGNYTNKLNTNLSSNNKNSLQPLTNDKPIKIMSWNGTSSGSPTIPTSIGGLNQNGQTFSFGTNATTQNFAGFALFGQDLLNNSVVSGQTYTARVNLTLSNTP